MSQEQVGTSSAWGTVFMAFSLFNLFGLIMNFNTLIKIDDDYILLDSTVIPNLRTRSFRIQK